MTNKKAANETFEKAKQCLEQNTIGEAEIYLIAALKSEIEIYANKTHNQDLNQCNYFAHYTNIETIYSILKHNEHIRLYDAFYINDPKEGTILREEFEKRYQWLKSAKKNTDAFICSFVKGDENVGDNLMYWQSYGKNGLGCSIQLSPYYDHTKELKRVLYGKDNLKDIQEMFQKYFELATKLFDKTDQKEDFATDFWKGFDEIKFLYKNEFYKDEKECRLVKIINKSSKEIEYDLKGEGPYLRTFLLDEMLTASKVLTSGSKVVVGPAVRKANHMCQNLRELANSKKLFGPEFISSEIPYQKFW